MPQRSRHRRDSSRPRVVALLAMALTAVSTLISACASTTDALGPDAGPLERLAQRQIDRPSLRSTTAPPPEGLRLDPIDVDADPQAYESLDNAIERFADQSFPNPWRGMSPKRETTAPTKAEALRRYIAGRSELVGGNVAKAIAHLDAASTLDPTAPEIWRTLADAHWLAGDRLAATASYLRAIDRNPDDIISLMRVGLTESERRSPETAVILLARAHRAMQTDQTLDAAIPYIVDVALGRALHDLGWLKAGNEACVGALDELITFTQPTSYRRELSAAIRSAGDVWREVGDASIRLGRPGEALDAYGRAAELPTFDPAALLTRRVYANMRLGRPASAAMLLVDRIAQLRGLVDNRTLRLIGYLTRSSDIGPTLASAIERIEQSLNPDERRVAASQLTRARAAALPDAQALRVLIDRLTVAPSDESAVSDLLSRRAPDDAPGLVELVSRLIESNTIEARRYTDALLRYAPDLEALLDALQRRIGASPDGSIGDDLLAAALSFDLGDIAGAQAMLDTASALRPDDPGVQLARALLAINTGRHDQARTALEAIDIEENQSAALAVAKAYRRLGDHQRALTILEDRVWGGQATAEEALVAGELSITLGAPVDAEQFFKLAIELDPSLEESHAGLITLYQNNGPLANQANLSDALRALRKAIPSSQTLRWLRVQDLLRLDRLDQAQRELLSLAEESRDPVVVEQLISVWIRTNAADKARRWLTEQLERRPNSPALVRFLARVQASQEDTDAAIATLQSWLSRHPADDDASRELENILRLEIVNRHEDADAIALTRLNRSAPSARRAMELAPILIRQKRLADAVKALEEPLVNEQRINPALLQNYDLIVTGVAKHAAQQANDDPETAAAALDLLRLFLLRFPDSPPASHMTLVTLLIETKAPTPQIAQAVVAAGSAHPDFSDNFTLVAVDQLDRAKRRDDAFTVITESVRSTDKPSDRALSVWIYLALINDNPEIAAEALDRIEERRLGVQTLTALKNFNNLLGVTIQETESGAYAELAFLAASFFAGDGVGDISERFYLLALKHNPRHAMANNNLAYNWVEQGINLDRAHEMLKIAYEEAPGSDAIVDSLGWVRYKLGMIDDQRDAQGNIVLQGAVSLLTAAAKLSKDAGASEILDHLGDAQWRMGQTDRAIETWRRSRTILMDLLRQPNLSSRDQALVDTILPKVQSKLDAVAGGEVPPLAPMLRPRRWTQENLDETPNDHSQGAPL